MKIMTCNIRCYGGDDGDDHWNHRKDFCADVIRSREPDVIGFQEMWAVQFADLKPLFLEYDSYGVIDEPLGKHPMNTVFYRRDRFDLLSAGCYWLSESPHVTGSKSWDSACVRFANWLRLVDLNSGKEFRIINTHFDHRGQVARENQARIICEDAVSYPDNFPQILTGDLNCDYTNSAIAVLKNAGWKDTYGAVHETEDPGFTFHQFKGPDYASSSKCGKMDWVFGRGEVTAISAEVIDDDKDGRFPSDHYFVSAEVQL